MQHETRAMIDGQIHDIGRVGRHLSLQSLTHDRLLRYTLRSTDIQSVSPIPLLPSGSHFPHVQCRVTTNVEYEYPEETVVTREDIHTLDLLGIEKAQSILKEKNDTIRNVSGIATSIAAIGSNVILATSRPACATAEYSPSTTSSGSDISVTKDGSIIAYGMIPLAGDELTELIVQHYLVDSTSSHTSFAGMECSIIMISLYVIISPVVLASLMRSAVWKSTR